MHTEKGEWEWLFRFPIVLLICRSIAALLAAGSIAIAAWINTRPRLYLKDMDIVTSMGVPPYEFYWYGPQLCISLLFNGFQIFYLFRNKKQKLWPGCVAIIDGAIMVWLIIMVILFLSTMAKLNTVIIQAVPALFCGLVHFALSIYSCCNAPICCCQGYIRQRSERRRERSVPANEYAYGSEEDMTTVQPPAYTAQPIVPPPAAQVTSPSPEPRTTNIVDYPARWYY